MPKQVRHDKLKIENFCILYYPFIMRKKKAQILLVVIMILSTVMTVIMAVSFSSITDTKTTKLEQENKKALSAAEAAIEALLKDQTNSVSFGSGSLSSFSDITGQAVLDTTQSNNFEIPLVKKNEAYTFYLATYDKKSNTFSQSINTDLEVCFNSDQALEITLIKTNAIKKYVVDGEVRIDNATTPSSPPSSICLNSGYNQSFTISSSDISTDSQLLIVKNLFADGKIYFKSTSGLLPQQGKTVVSSATTKKTGVSKKVVLFQTYPQIPAEFFYTGF